MQLATGSTGRAAEFERRGFDPAPAPAFETSPARGLFWRPARAEPNGLESLAQVFAAERSLLAASARANESNRPKAGR
jgi:hypothetical protein